MRETARQREERREKKRNYFIWKTGYPRSNEVRLTNGKFSLNISRYPDREMYQDLEQSPKGSSRRFIIWRFQQQTGQSTGKNIVGENPALTERRNE